ncbi:Na+/H+ antiporter NhaA [Phytopseudomonas dryadis]|uniref:Na(+)/H(+) antiporter NhaA n=1 Tax=Phytopseudomonas dryadis TaxID=2487520 RepID=A0A4Q9QT86_9GAMM|nr:MULTISPECIES: Na+/H+ antiporter NhaA [Pseudomonas]TBU85656.1 Na+/H+ antiporter NhaA [Pseudomonas dryadis]TBV02032.1 Na+/H+ antiporter NhaA [Pseudomonas dryadis]TBV14861.1 Na+/H+ antiporter NhaA [Pseudomonas sp. FRB 230]
MKSHPNSPELPRAQRLVEHALARLRRLLQLEAISGVVLLCATALALLWANSPLAGSYHALWHTPFTIGLGTLVFSQSLHFWINDGLMTLFFLVVGMEIRREIHDGALSDFRQALLPIAAACGGVMLPALIYLAVNGQGAGLHGWAIPTATDIAFAVGLLALLGRGIPSGVRVFLLTLAVIDDVIAVLLIAFFYSDGLDYSGFALAGLGALLVLGLQRIGAGSAYAYVLPGALMWLGLLMTGAHPTLAGVVLGLLTPVSCLPMRERPRDVLSRVAGELQDNRGSGIASPGAAQSLRELRIAQRELLPPVVRVQLALHPWVTYGLMPLFALANAGVSLGGIDLSPSEPHWVMLGVAIALLVGKPAGVIGVSWLMVRLGFCRLPADVSWRGVALIGLLAGIGFTMSIFIANLAFADPNLLGAAKLGVLSGSLVSALVGLAWGALYMRRLGLAQALREA